MSLKSNTELPKSTIDVPNAVNCEPNFSISFLPAMPSQRPPSVGIHLTNLPSDSAIAAALTVLSIDESSSPDTDSWNASSNVPRLLICESIISSPNPKVAICEKAENISAEPKITIAAATLFILSIDELSTVLRLFMKPAILEPNAGRLSDDVTIAPFIMPPIKSPIATPAVFIKGSAKVTNLSKLGIYVTIAPSTYIKLATPIAATPNITIKAPKPIAPTTAASIPALPIWLHTKQTPDSNSKSIPRDAAVSIDASIFDARANMARVIPPRPINARAIIPNDRSIFSSILIRFRAINAVVRPRTIIVIASAPAIAFSASISPIAMATPPRIVNITPIEMIVPLAALQSLLTPINTANIPPIILIAFTPFIIFLGSIRDNKATMPSIAAIESDTATNSTAAFIACSDNFDNPTIAPSTKPKTTNTLSDWLTTLGFISVIVDNILTSKVTLTVIPIAINPNLLRFLLNSLFPTSNPIAPTATNTGTKLDNIRKEYDGFKSLIFSIANNINNTAPTAAAMPRVAFAIPDDLLTPFATNAIAPKSTATVPSPLAICFISILAVFSRDFVNVYIAPANDIIVNTPLIDLVLSIAAIFIAVPNAISIPHILTAPNTTVFQSSPSNCFIARLINIIAAENDNIAVTDDLPNAVSPLKFNLGLPNTTPRTTNIALRAAIYPNDPHNAFSCFSIIYASRVTAPTKTAIPIAMSLIYPVILCCFKFLLNSVKHLPNELIGAVIFEKLTAALEKFNNASDKVFIVFRTDTNDAINTVAIKKFVM